MENDYGPCFGEAGDVIGALVEFRRIGPRVSFMLNGEPLGTAFSVMDCKHPALQPHIFQVPGEPFSVLLRGASAEHPLRFPMPGFNPIADVTKEHFCPFSRAIEGATDVRVPVVARRLIHGCLGLELPVAHIAQERLPRVKAAAQKAKAAVSTEKQASDTVDLENSSLDAVPMAAARETVEGKSIPSTPLAVSCSVIRAAGA